MNEKELVDLMQYVAKQMGSYENIRAGGNLGTAIQGFLQYKGSEEVALSIDRLTEEIKNTQSVLQEIIKNSK